MAQAVGDHVVVVLLIVQGLSEVLDPDIALVDQRLVELLFLDAYLLRYQMLSIKWILYFGPGILLELPLPDQLIKQPHILP